MENIMEMVNNPNNALDINLVIEVARLKRTYTNKTKLLEVAKNEGTSLAPNMTNDQIAKAIILYRRLLNKETK